MQNVSPSSNENFRNQQRGKMDSSVFWREIGKETLHQTASDFIERIDLKKK